MSIEKLKACSCGNSRFEIVITFKEWIFADHNCDCKFHKGYDEEVLRCTECKKEMDLDV